MFLRIGNPIIVNPLFPFSEKYGLNNWPVPGCVSFDQNLSWLTTFIKLLHPVFPDTIFQCCLASSGEERQPGQDWQWRGHLSHGSTVFGVQVLTGPAGTADSRTIQNWITESGKPSNTVRDGEKKTFWQALSLLRPSPCTPTTTTTTTHHHPH